MNAGLELTKGDLCQDPKIPTQDVTLRMPHGEYVQSWSPSEFLTDCNNSGHPGSFSQEYSHEDIPTFMDGSVLDMCNNSQATHQLVVGSSSLASRPQPAKRSKVEGRPYHIGFTPQDVENLINGVEEYSHKGRTSWKSIVKLDYFKGTLRTENQLKDKWRDMVKSADTEVDPILKDLYTRAKNIEAERKSERQNSFLQKLRK